MLEFWFECLSIGAKEDFGELNDGLIERAKGIEREPEESQGKRMAARETKGNPGPPVPSPPALPSLHIRISSPQRRPLTTLPHHPLGAMPPKSSLPKGLWKVDAPLGAELRYMLVHLQVARCAVGMLKLDRPEQEQFYGRVGPQMPPIKLKISYEGGRGEKGTRHILRDPLALLLNEKINSEGFDHCSLK